MLESLKDSVFKANMLLVKYGLVTLTWGNVSGIDRNTGIIAIKPSGVDYDLLCPEDIVLVNLNGEKIEGKMNPSSDTPTHLELYKSFSHIGGVVHTHSTYATIFAQAQKEIPCLGTTHADCFYGNIPLTRLLSKQEVATEYEKNTGIVITERFTRCDSHSNQGVLVAGHGPFTWGKDPMESVNNSLALECIAKMAYSTLQLNPEINIFPEYIINKHYSRKHGPSAYYGQLHDKGVANE